MWPLCAQCHAQFAGSAGVAELRSHLSRPPNTTDSQAFVPGQHLGKSSLHKLCLVPNKGFVPRDFAGD